MLKEVIAYTCQCEDTLTVADAVEVVQASVSLMHEGKSVMKVVENLVGAVIMDEFMSSLMATMCMNFYVVANQLSPEKVKAFAEQFGAEVKPIKVAVKGGHYDA